MVDIAQQLAPSGNGISLTPTTVGSYTAYQVLLETDIQIAEDKIDTEISFIYAYIDGYWLAAPNAALLERAILQYHSGVGLLADSEFQSLLPEGGYLDVSALSFNRIGQLLSDLSKSLPSGLTPDQRDSLREVRINNRGGSMVTLIGEPDSIRFVHSGESLFSVNLSSILSMQSVAGILIGEEQLIEVMNPGAWDNTDDWDDDPSVEINFND